MNQLALLCRFVTRHANAFSYCLTGIMFGMAICNLLTGLILKHIPGWDPAFYIYGGLGIVWWVVWIFVCYSNPDTHPFITENESEFLKASIKVHKVNACCKYSLQDILHKNTYNL